MSCLLEVCLLLYCFFLTFIAGRFDIDRSELLDKYDEYLGKEKHYTGSILVYITPWNSKGYEYSRAFADKLMYISPVWFQIIKNDLGDILLNGEHDVDLTWLHQIREEHRIRQQQQQLSTSCSDNIDTCVQLPFYIVPRVIFECVIDGSDEIERVMILLFQMKDKYNFDGYTLEMSSSPFATFIELPKALKKKFNCQLVFVLPPISVDANKESINLRHAIEELSKNVDVLSVMTYDNNRHGGPNAPIIWVNQIIKGLASISSSVRRKIFMGIPLYGWNSQGDALISDSMVQWLRSSATDVKVEWDDVAKEHVFADIRSRSGSSQCYYPTQEFVEARLRLAENLKVGGVALWELGQTMPYLMSFF